MVSLEKSVIINRPVADVFAFVMNPANEPLINPSTLVYEQLNEGPIGVGSTIRIVNSFLGRQVESTFEVAEYELNRKRVMKSLSGPYPYEVANLFEAVDDGTRFTAKFQADIGGFFRLAEPIVNRMVDRQSDAVMANLKDLLEAKA